MTSSNPAVVIRAVRAPLRSSRVLVPTVVPCRRISSPRCPIFCRASAIACDGSAGVEKTFSMRRRPLASVQTQSVKVPPVSMATRNGWERRGMELIRRVRVICAAMRYTFLGCLVVLSLWAAGPLQGQDQPPRVERNTFVSAANPKIRVKVEKNFKYVGRGPFAIEDQAQGSRYVFVRATGDKHIRQMFIIQQEGFLASSDEIYRYKITNPVRLGRSDYQHS